MSRETDGIVQLHRGSRLGGRVTSITSSAVGRASGTFHERKATPSATDKKGKGLAVDFGDDTGDAPTATKLAIFHLFVQANNLLIKQGKRGLAELFYSHAPFFIKYGKQIPIAQLDKNGSTYKLHKNHVHVAVQLGTFLASTPAVASAQAAAAVTVTYPPARAELLGTAQIEDSMKITSYKVLDHPLDPEGNGWKLMNGDRGPRVPFNRLVAITPLGPAPQRDGYSWPNLYMAANETEGLVEVSFEGGAPKGVASFVIAYVED